MVLLAESMVTLKLVHLHGLLAETVLLHSLMVVYKQRHTPADFIQPLFVVEGAGIQRAIPALPGIDHLSIDRIVEAAKAAHGLGIPAIALFPVIAPNLKTADGKIALDKDGLVPRCVRAVKAAVPNTAVFLQGSLDQIGRAHV